jgi:hypothetical protein
MRGALPHALFSDLNIANRSHPPEYFCRLISPARARLEFRSEWHLLKSKPFMLLTGSIPVALEDGRSCVYRLVLHVWAASVVV